jgi:hypothetical protein
MFQTAGGAAGQKTEAKGRLKYHRANLHPVDFVVTSAGSLEIPNCDFPERRLADEQLQIHTYTVMFSISHYDKRWADFAVGFIPTFMHTAGEWFGRLLRLMPWQEQDVRETLSVS